MPQDRRRHVLRDALVVLAAGVALLLVLEAGARWLGLGAPELPELPPKAPGSFRILAFGGSTVLGVPDGDLGFATQLALGLGELAGERRVELLNLGRAGAGSAEVRALFEASADAEADLAIVLIGHNEFIAPRASRGVLGALQRLRDASRLARALTAGEVVEPLAFGAPIPALPPGRREAAAADFRANLDAIVAEARRRAVPLLLCTAPSNLADWPPAERFVVRKALSEQAAREREALLTARAPEIAGAERWLAAHGEDASVRYRLGRALRDAGRRDPARRAFVLAREHDPVPRRALEAFQEAVRAHASTPGVSVVDLDRHFGELAPAGLVGFELVADNCHPTPLGNAHIAWRLAHAMRATHRLLPRDADLGAPTDWLARARRRIGDAEAQARAHVRWLLSNGIYAMKSPFHQLEVSRMYLERARALAPRDWRVHANLGTLDVLEGELERGRRALARAESLKGEALDPTDRGPTPYLAEALERLAPAAGGS